MGQIAVTVMNAVDTRVFECLLPDDEQLALLVARLAETLRFPVVGPDNYPLTYGLIIKDGGLLSPDIVLGELDLPEPIVMRLAPELCANSENFTLPTGEKSKQRTMFSAIKAVEVTPISKKSSLSRFDVWLDAAVHKDIEIYARRHSEIECTGLLLGNLEEDHNQRVVHITAAIFAEDAVGSRTSVRITLQAWEKMLGLRDTKHASLKVLGWFHTHLGLGVFMSDSDMFIHRRFFERSDMVAYVLDPTSERDAFFRWRDGQVIPCASYGLACCGSSEAEMQRHASGCKLDWRKIIRWGLALLIALGLAAGIFVHLALVRYNRHMAPKTAPRKLSGVKQTPGNAEITYIISSGETLWGLSEEVYGSGSMASKLARYNGLKNPRSMQAGQQLRIPSREALDKYR
ncbi:MAG: LysM peptidoglycan-binding domain-containing protein [Armatimonadetes bacterium]|nr:LysM peptidoglycan-binding domain-containing protein [Armatimonadota bacterium]